MQQREIKFRVWDGKDKKMIYSDVHVEHPYPYFSIDLAGKLWQCDWYPDDWVDRELGQYVVQQYIGKKDCKGCEIYEGDMGNYRYCDGSGGKGIIEWGGGGFQIDGVHCLHEVEVEVIGNIHENPELLKVK